jgi:hypothetical protein
MKKKDELAKDAKGCLAKANDNEMLFILRAQDVTAPKVVLHWIAKNFEITNEEKLREAFECALAMKRYKGRKNPD